MGKAEKIKLEITTDQPEEIQPLTWLEMHEIAKNMPPRKFFAEGIIDSEGISVVFAPIKSFKSAFLSHIANAVSLGTSPFEGIKNSYTEPHKVLYLDSELYIQDWDERYLFDKTQNLKVLPKERFSLMNIDLGVNEFIGFLDKNFRAGYRMIVIDNLSLVVPQASDHKVAAEYISALNNLMGRLKDSGINAALVIVAHSTKESIKADFGMTTQSMGGAYAWQKPAQSVVALNKRSDLNDGEYGFYVKVLETRRRNNSGISQKNVLAFRVEGDEKEPMDLICEGIMREEECLGVGGIPNLERNNAKSSEAKMSLLALLEAADLGTNLSVDFVSQVFNVSSNTIKQYKNAKRFPEARGVFDRVKISVEQDDAFWVKTWEGIKEGLHKFGGEYPTSLPKHIQAIIDKKRKSITVLDAFEESLSGSDRAYMRESETPNTSGGSEIFNQPQEEAPF